MKSKIFQIISGLMLVAIVLGAASQPALAIALNPAIVLEQSVTEPSGPIDPAEFEAFLDEYLAEQMESHHIPGAVFTMVKDGKIFFSKGYGYADLENEVHMDPEETLLITASLAKVFTAVGVLQLNERGAIDLNEDIRPHFKEFPLKTNFEEPLTFANLLTHTDGFEARMIGTGARTQDDLLPLSELLETYTPTQLYPPGKYMTYSDHASNLGGYLTQEISGVPFEQYMAENILNPLGMTSSSFYQPPPEQFLNRQAVGYEFQEGMQISTGNFYTRYAPGGGLRTTAADMSQFMLALLNGGENILNQSSIEMMFTQQFTPHPQVAGITYGLFEHLENGQRLFLRDGDGAGTRSRMVLFPDQDLGFFISYNSGDSNLRLNIISALLDHYYLAVDSSDPQPLEGYQQRASRYEGAYRILQGDMNTFGKSMYLFSQQIEVDADDNGFLQLSPAGGGDSFGGFEGSSQWVEVEPLYFERVDGKGNIAFVEDGDGRIIRMISGQGYHGTFVKLPWYATQSFQMILIEVVAVLAISMVVSTFLIWPLNALIRKLRKKSNQNPMPRGAVFARLWAGITCGMFALFTLRAIGVLYAIDAVPGMPNFVWGVSPEMVASLNSIYLPAVLALALPVFTLLAWLKGWWKTSTRVYYTLVTLGVFTGLWWTNYWNLLGFRI